MHEIIGDSGAGIIVNNFEDDLLKGLMTVLQDNENYLCLKRMAIEKSRLLSSECAAKEYTMLFDDFGHN